MRRDGREAGKHRTKCDEVSKNYKSLLLYCYQRADWHTIAEISGKLQTPQTAKHEQHTHQHTWRDSQRLSVAASIN